MRLQFKKNLHTKTGFTLVEVLVTIVVIGVIGYMLSDILIKSLNNGRKSQVIGNVKQNAQVALTNMSSVIRNADTVTCPLPVAPATSASGPVVALLNKDGSYTRFWYQPSAGPNSNGYLFEDFPTSADYPALGNVAESINLCNSGTYPAVRPVQMTDSSTVSGVSVTNGLFTVVQNIGTKDSVTISFDFNSSISNTGNQNTLGALTHYETTVQLR